MHDSYQADINIDLLSTKDTTIFVGVVYSFRAMIKSYSKLRYTGRSRDNRDSKKAVGTAIGAPGESVCSCKVGSRVDD